MGGESLTQRRKGAKGEEGRRRREQEIVTRGNVFILFSKNSRILVFQRWTASADIDPDSIKICDWRLIGEGLKSEVSVARQRVENHEDMIILVPWHELNPGLYSVTIGRGPEFMFGVLTPDEEEFWNSVLKGHPDYWQAHNHLGGLLYMRGDFNGAYPHFLKAVQINPQNPESRNNLGLALQKRGDLDGAIEQYKDALKIVDSGVIAANLGNAYEQANKLDDAVEAYRRAIALDGSIAPAHCNLGYVLMQQGEIDEAIKEFRKTVELDPTMPQGKGDLEEALRLKGGKD